MTLASELDSVSDSCSCIGLTSITDQALGERTGRFEVGRGTGGGTEMGLGLGNEACGRLGEGGKLDIPEVFDVMEDLDPLLRCNPGSIYVSASPSTKVGNDKAEVEASGFCSKENSVRRP